MICKVCNKIVKNNHSLIIHIRKHSISNKEYYDKYLKKEKENKCLVCGKETKFISFNKGYKLCCCKAHTDKINCLEKYGVENVFQLPKIKEKIKQTNLQKYGFENPSKSEKIKQKKKETCNKLYGCDNAFQNFEKQEKYKKTMVDRYGVENPNQLEKIKQKKKETCIRKYGVENVFQSEEIKKKLKETNLKKYGVEHPIVNTSIGKWKEYVLPSGKIIKVQGYEPKALDDLFEQGYKEEDLVIQQRKEMPKIFYFDCDGKKHRYYPDIYIKSENKIIEVKSTYTYDLYKRKNLLKEQACLKEGYNFEFKIY